MVLSTRGRELLGGLSMPLSVKLLAVGGTALVGAGALLAWRHGAMVSLGESVLIAIAWCF
jgi:hypothetical protein